jgi:threonine dehydratase
MVCIIIGTNNFEIIRNFVEDIILVSDKEIKKYVIFVFGKFGSSCNISNCIPSRKVYHFDDMVTLYCL